jgi:ubiquinone biosynthesis protein
MEGSLTTLDPGFDMLSQARSFATGQLHAGLHPSSARDALNRELTSVLPMLRRLPRHLDQVAAALEDGRLRMNIRLLADRRDRAIVTEWLHLAALTFLGGSTGLMAALLLGTTAGPAVTPTISLFQLFGYLLVVISAILILRVLFDIFRGGRRD